MASRINQRVERVSGCCLHVLTPQRSFWMHNHVQREWLRLCCHRCGLRCGLCEQSEQAAGADVTRSGDIRAHRDNLRGGQCGIR